MSYSTWHANQKRPSVFWYLDPILRSKDFSAFEEEIPKSFHKHAINWRWQIVSKNPRTLLKINMFRTSRSSLKALWWTVSDLKGFEVTYPHQIWTLRKWRLLYLVTIYSLFQRVCASNVWWTYEMNTLIYALFIPWNIS